MHLRSFCSCCCRDCCCCCVCCCSCCCSCCCYSNCCCYILMWEIRYGHGLFSTNSRKPLRRLISNLLLQLHDLLHQVPGFIRRLFSCLPLRGLLVLSKRLSSTHSLEFCLFLAHQIFNLLNTDMQDLSFNATALVDLYVRYIINTKNYWK